MITNLTDEEAAAWIHCALECAPHWADGEKFADHLIEALRARRAKTSESGNDSGSGAPRQEPSTLSPAQAPKEPGLTPRWRVGRTLGRTLYRDGLAVGVIETREIAEEIVRACNQDVDAGEVSSPVCTAVAPPAVDERGASLEPDWEALGRDLTLDCNEKAWNDVSSPVADWLRANRDRIAPPLAPVPRGPHGEAPDRNLGFCGSSWGMSRTFSRFCPGCGHPYEATP